MRGLGGGSRVGLSGGSRLGISGGPGKIYGGGPGKIYGGGPIKHSGVTYGGGKPFVRHPGLGGKGPFVRGKHPRFVKHRFHRPFFVGAGLYSYGYYDECVRWHPAYGWINVCYPYDY
jgi:hypothetical protein